MGENKSDRIRNLMAQHPTAAVNEIAAMVPCRPEYVRLVRDRAGGQRPCDVAWIKANPDVRRRINREAQHRFHHEGGGRLYKKLWRQRRVGKS